MLAPYLGKTELGSPATDFRLTCRISFYLCSAASKESGRANKDPSQGEEICRGPCLRISSPNRKVPRPRGSAGAQVQSLSRSAQWPVHLRSWRAEIRFEPDLFGPTRFLEAQRRLAGTSVTLCQSRGSADPALPPVIRHTGRVHAGHSPPQSSRPARGNPGPVSQRSACSRASLPDVARSAG